MATESWIPILQHSSIPIEKKRFVGKVIASVFWEVNAVLIVDFPQKFLTVHGPYNVSLLWHLNDHTRFGKYGNFVLFHLDNAFITIAVMYDSTFQLFWKSDLIAYFLSIRLFQKLKKAKTGTTSVRWWRHTCSGMETLEQIHNLTCTY